MVDFTNEQDQPSLHGAGHIPNYPILGDPIEKFMAHLADHSIAPPEEIITDGNLHRYAPDGSKEKTSWYVFHMNDICGAAFGDWAKDIKDTWCSKDVGRLSYHERERYREIQRLNAEARAAQERENHENAKALAEQIWAAADPVGPSGHTYLINKGLYHEYGARAGKDPYGRTRLMVPSMDDFGNVHSLQFIDHDGSKRFQSLGRRKGLFFEIPGNPDSKEIYIAEGFATAGTIRTPPGPG